MSGEQLNYKIYCLNYTTNKTSDLSKVAYIELINSKKKSVLKQKILLENGLGQGDFFINTNLKSGNYKLIAYTEWMKNGNLYFEDDIAIINPFSDKLDRTESDEKNKNSTKTIYNQNNSNYKINLNKELFTKREKVTLNIENFNSGDFSVSVRAVNPNLFNKKQSVDASFKTVEVNAEMLKNKTVFLPEFRGELIQGKLTSTSNNFQKSDVRIGLSVIQKNGFFKISNTDKNGIFYFNIVEPYTANNVELQILDAVPSEEKINIKIINNNDLDYKNLSFSKLKTDAKIDSIINFRSSYVQIENAFASIKQDTLLKTQNLDYFKNIEFITYKLDDFTRFKTLKETMTEIIKGSWIEKKGNQYQFNIRNRNVFSTFNTPPLVVLDGFLVYNHNDIIDINTKTINTISLNYKTYKYNSKIYEGIIHIETFKGDYKPKESKNKIAYELFKPLNKKKYFKQSYADSKAEKIPDYRTQLLWQPVLDINKNNISFFTSDVTGQFEINIEGFNTNGKPISLRKVFEVE